MKKIIMCLAIFISSTVAFAVDVKDSDLQGRWLIVKMGTMDASDMNDVWEFKNGKWTPISSGKALKPDAYTLKGDIIDLGYTKIQIIEFSGNQMKTKQQGFEYTLEKQ